MYTFRNSSATWDEDAELKMKFVIGEWNWKRGGLEIAAHISFAIFQRHVTKLLNLCGNL